MVNLGLRRVEDSVAAKHPVRPAGARVDQGGLCAACVPGAAAIRRLPVPRLHEGHRHLPGRERSRLRSAEAGGQEAAVQPAVEPAAGGGYVVTRAETQKCSDFWIYLETGKSPQELAMASRASEPTENLPIAEDRESTALPVRRNKYGDVVE